ncbi:hypothetical protein CH372_13770 [Leptospira meyeri]|nr:hypothetical protein CH372_13770 [Leptospira meyeri]PKA22996.1 hypothetical protein CH381_28050 [Leptospira sp. mixed culture ATI2-C-A1]
MISAWEAGILANRSPEQVNRNFAEFYKEQVLAGNIKKDNYGGTVGVFYNSDKPYLELQHYWQPRIAIYIPQQESRKQKIF